MTKEHPKILLVEDEPDVCSSIQSYLGRRGFLVATTASGADALLLTSLSRPDVMVLDFTLEDLDGREVLKKLRASDKDTKVIVITGQLLPPEEIDKIRALDVCEYFHKPVSLEKLESVINKIIGRRAVCPVVKTKKNYPSPAFSRSSTHKLSNLLGVIRYQCEGFVLNIKDGIYREKSPEDLVKISVAVMKDVIDTVDKAARVIDNIGEEK